MLPSSTLVILIRSSRTIDNKLCHLTCINQSILRLIGIRTKASQFVETGVLLYNSAPNARGVPNDAPSPLVDTSGARLWMADRIVGHEQPTRHAPSSDSAPLISRTETHYSPLVVCYQRATRRIPKYGARGVPDVVEKYKSSKRTATATDDVKSTRELASREARKLAIDNDLTSEFEIIYKACEHLGSIKVESGCTNDLDGRNSIGHGFVNVSVDRKGALSCEAPQILKI